jgi:hypothetical protein
VAVNTVRSHPTVGDQYQPPTTYFSRSIQMKMTKAAKKVGKVMGEYKAGTLHSGKGGKVVKNPKQAIAIAMSEAKMPMRGSRTAKNMKSKGMK